MLNSLQKTHCDEGIKTLSKNTFTLQGTSNTSKTGGFTLIYKKIVPGEKVKSACFACVSCSLILSDKYLHRFKKFYQKQILKIRCIFSNNSLKKGLLRLFIPHRICRKIVFEAKSQSKITEKVTCDIDNNLGYRRGF